MLTEQPGALSHASLEHAGRLLLHVGYHKTATTWLQDAVFTPEHGYVQVVDHRTIFDLVARPHDLDFEPSTARTALAARLADAPPGLTPVVSSETLIGLPFDGARDSARVAERLAMVLPGARILITIREQAKIIASVYMQYMRRGGTLPPEEFFEAVDEPGYFGFDPSHFAYHRLVGLYQRLFGAEHVLVLPQESFRRGADEAMSRLAEFAGNTGFHGLSDSARRARGVSDPEYMVPVLRRLNHLAPSVMTPSPALNLGSAARWAYRAARHLGARPVISSRVSDTAPVTRVARDRFGGRFADSNRQLLASHHGPLDLTGYDGFR